MKPTNAYKALRVYYIILYYIILYYIILYYIILYYIILYYIILYYIQARLYLFHILIHVPVDLELIWIWRQTAPQQAWFKPNTYSRKYARRHIAEGLNLHHNRCTPNLTILIPVCSIHLQHFGLQHVAGSVTITQLLESNLTSILIRFMNC